MMPQPSRRRHSVSRPRAAPRAPLRLRAIVILLALVLLPIFAGRNLIQDLIFLFYMLALAQCWNLLAGYAGLISVGQQAFVGLGGYLLFALTHLGRPQSAARDPARGRLSPRCWRCRLRWSCSACAAPISRSAPGSWPRSIVWSSPSSSRSAAAPERRCTPSVTSSVPGIEWVKALFDLRTPAARDIVSYWVALALMAGTLAVVYLILRSRRGPCARRDPRSRGRGRGPRRRHLPHQARRLCRDRRHAPA